MQGRKRNGILTIKEGNGVAQPTKWYSDSRKLVILSSTSALDRGILKQRRGKISTHFNGHAVNTELLFQTVHSVIQLSVYGAAANWCCKFGLTEEEKGRVGIPVDNKILTMVEPEEVELLVSPPTQALGNRMQGSALSFQTLERRYSLHNSVKKPSSNICDCREDVQNSTRCG